MDSVSPVLTVAEVEAEQVIALGQEEYYPIIVARVAYSDDSNISLTRYRPSPTERALLAAGADILLGQPHHSSMMPISIQLAMPGDYPAAE
jgi:hypothetical protein